MALCIEYDRKITRVAVTSSTIMVQVVEAARDQLAIANDSNRSFLLIYRKCPVDLSMPFRLTGIPNLATVEMKRNDFVSKTDKMESIRISVQLPDGKRKTTTANKHDTFHSIFTTIGLLPSPLTFKIQFMQREISPSDFGAVSLQDFGITNGSALLRVRPCGKSNSNESQKANTSAAKPEPTPIVEASKVSNDVKLVPEKQEEDRITESNINDEKEELKDSSDRNETLHEEKRKSLNPVELLILLRQNCSDIDSREAIITLMKIVTNILSQPENAKVRSIKLSNAKFYSNVGRHPGGIEFLCSLGFVTNDEAGILRLPFGQSNMSKVLGGLDALRAEADALNIEYSSLPTVTQPRGESITEVALSTLQAKEEEVLSAQKVARNTTFLLNSNCSILGVPEAASESDQTDSQIIIQSSKARREKLEREQNFRTRAMRELDTMRQKRVFTKTVIRVRFPDRVILQAHFHPTEKVSDLVAHIQENLDTGLEPDGKYFSLYTTPTRQRLQMEDTLLQANLVPAAVVHLSWEDTEAIHSHSILRGGYLREVISFGAHSEEVVDDQIEYPKSIVLDPNAPANKASETEAKSKKKPELGARKTRKPAWLK
ncbi:unnamed protein product [Albugo candida]|uniref:UBX domain-containing protein n=2 Tax=Albugo candida TaxID=65357 RepID=A0A024G004_9STRA|nr:unnamed protein product [Albugo candida]|eukprot:CCI39650.1 unnamed protein product [Albugo candida]